MANLKMDVFNKISNDKYFEELELVRLAQDPNMNYKDKVDSIVNTISKIALLNANLGLVEVYFREPEAQQAAPAPLEVKKHQGQTHGE